MIPIYLLIAVFLAASITAAWVGLVIVDARKTAALMKHAFSEEDRVRMKGLAGGLKPVLSDMASKLFSLPRTEGLRRWAEARYADKLRKAGYPGLLSPEEIVVIKLLLPPVLFAVFALAVPPNLLIIAPAVAVVGFILPDIKLSDLAKRRTDDLRLGLPDALDSFFLMMRAGLDLGAAVDTYIREPNRNALQDEFYIMRAQMRLGKTRSEALQDMARRLNFEEFDTVVNALIEAEKSGVSMTDFLSSQSRDERIRRFNKAEEIGQKAPFKMLAPLMLFILPGVFLVLFAPMAIKYVTGQF